MSNTSMFYREIPAPQEISHLVLSFWEFLAKGENHEPIVHEVFPDGCISLVYKRNRIFGIDGLFSHGLNLEIFKTEVYAGDVIWGIRFMPSACAKILRFDPAQVQSRPVDEIADFTHLTQGLLEKLVACVDFDEAVKVYEAKIKSLELKSDQVDKKIAEAVEVVEENRGEVKIGELAKIVGLSTRQLERRFRQSAGLSPKQFARARRIRATAISLVEESEMNWARRAAEMGFTDQAHLTHEFSMLTGRSPNSFAKKVKQIEHGKLVK